MNVQGILCFFFKLFCRILKKKIQETESFGETIAIISLGSSSLESRLSW